MSDLQHQRLTELSRELRLSAVPDLYSTIAQSAAAKSASFADFLEGVLRAERDARRARAREMSPGWPASRRSRRSTALTSALLPGYRASKSTSSPGSPSSSADYYRDRRQVTWSNDDGSPPVDGTSCARSLIFFCCSPG